MRRPIRPVEAKVVLFLGLSILHAVIFVPLVLQCLLYLGQVSAQGTLLSSSFGRNGKLTIHFSYTPDGINIYTGTRMSYTQYSGQKYLVVQKFQSLKSGFPIEIHYCQYWPRISAIDPLLYIDDFIIPGLIIAVDMILLLCFLYRSKPTGANSDKFRN